MFYENAETPIETFKGIGCKFAKVTGLTAVFYASARSYTQLGKPVNSMGFNTAAHMEHFFTMRGASVAVDPGQIDPPAPDPKAEAAQYLQRTEADGSMVRLIEDIADAVEALGGKLPQAAKDKIAARKAARAVLTK